MPVFLPATGPGHLLIEVRAGDQTAATITVPLASRPDRIWRMPCMKSELIYGLTLFLI
jgi:hypothetical protein